VVDIGSSTPKEYIDEAAQRPAGARQRPAVCIRPRPTQLGDDDWAKLRRTHIATLFQDGNLIPTLFTPRLEQTAPCVIGRQ